jgi:hypothetical protein
MGLLAIGAIVGVLALGGCSSPWKDHYAGSVSPGAPSARVTVREVPWERVDGALREIQRVRAESPVHRDEWTEAERAEEKATLLRGLQISEDPSRVEVLGRSVFRTTDAVDPGDGELAKFAGEIGADYAVWSSSYVGKTDRIEHEPVRRTGGGWGYDSDRRGRWGVYDGTWDVPVVVSADEYAWIAYFLRVR